jgi:hypothetical protein
MVVTKRVIDVVTNANEEADRKVLFASQDSPIGNTRRNAQSGRQSNPTKPTTFEISRSHPVRQRVTEQRSKGRHAWAAREKRSPNPNGDWAYAKRALARGDDPEEVIRRIADYRADEKHDPEYLLA